MEALGGIFTVKNGWNEAPPIKTPPAVSKSPLFVKPTSPAAAVISLFPTFDNPMPSSSSSVGPMSPTYGDCKSPDTPTESPKRRRQRSPLVPVSEDNFKDEVMDAHNCYMGGGYFKQASDDEDEVFGVSKPRMQMSSDSDNEQTVENESPERVLPRRGAAKIKTYREARDSDDERISIEADFR